MTNRLLILFIVCLPLLQSCSDKNKVKLLETNAKEEVPVLGNLSFVFNKNLAPDSILNRWETEEFIQFEPKIKGKFRWQNPNELVFSPSENLKPATEYKGTIQKSLTKYSKFLLGKTDGIVFHTPKLRIEQTSGMWIARELNTTDILPEVSLRFNYPIKPADVLKRLSIKNGGDRIEFQSQSEESSEAMVLRLTNVKPEDKDLNLSIEIEDGLVPIGGLSATQEPLKSEVNIASPFVLIIGQVTAEHDGVNGTVKVYCSQQIAENQLLKDFISFEPKVKFTAELTDEGIIITSEEFNVEKGYEVSFKTGLKGNVGGVLKEPSAHQITFGKLEPSISFVNSSGEYLSTKGEKNLEVRIVNVPEVKVTITKIYENNILSMRKYGYYGGYYDEYYEEGDYEQSGSDDYDATFGDVVYEKVINTSALPKYRNSRLFHFKFPDNLPEFKGIYFVKINSSNEYYLSDNKIVSFSDIGLITRTGKDKIYVFANSIVSASALNGVNITAYGLNNQKIGTGQTNSDGYAEIKLINKNSKGFAPAMITAKIGGDFNCMPFSNTRVETSRFDIGGVRSNATGLRAFIYGDRDIYRPGEKMIFSAIVRNQIWKSPGEIPVKMKVLLPNGKELKLLKKSLNSQGSMESYVQLDAAAVSGHYSLELYTSTDVLLATKALLVEEFMPDRIKVKAELDKKDYKPGEKLLLSLEAVNYFGPPASGRNYESELQLKERAFDSKSFPNYNFSLSQSNNYYESMLSEGVTNDEGKADEAFEIPAYYKDRGILQADIFTTVFDENGRPVSRASSAPVYTQQVFYGIKNDGYGYYQLNQPVRFNLVALNKDDKPFASTKAKLLVIKHEYKTVLSKSGSYFRYNSQLEDKTIVDKEITLSGSNSYYDFVPRSPGNYELRIARPGAGTYVSTSFYSYGYWGNYGNSFEVNREGNIDIALDKTSYHTGETAQVLFKTPFNGKMLVTVEQDEVISHQYVEVKNRAASISIDLKSEHLPNAYVTATLIKPHTQSNIPLTVAHGYTSLMIEDLTNKIPVRIEAVDKSRSNTKQRITVKSLPGAKVTLAAVDEGILQITGFKTPDPYGYFYAKRALETTAHDIYPFLLPELKGGKSTGGDGFDLSKRVNPLPNKRVKLVANWSGITDSKSGEIVFDVDIPPFSGEIRLMAVAYKDTRFGSADAKITVADPIVISTGLPRFLSPGDTAYVSVNLTNTTEKSASAQVKIITSGGIKSMENGYSAAITSNNENRQIVKLVAGNAIGTAKYTVSVSAFGETFKDEIDITVRPAASLQKEAKNGAITGGSSEVINISNSSFMPASETRSLVVSRSPVLQFAEHLEYLVQYPHGCTEQIVSSAFPQLYFGDISEMMLRDEAGKSFANANVQEAIRSIKMRQLYSGGLTLWESGGQEHWWASVYATHFLIEAKKAGYQVDNDLLNNLLDYLKAKVKQRNYVSYFYNRTENKRIAPKEMAYSLFVLAIANKADISTMNYYKQHQDELAIDSRFLLSAAYAIAGDKQKFREMLPISFSGEEANPETGGSFASAIRDEGIALYAIMEADLGNPLIGTMANHLSNQMKGRSYLTTQERSFAFLCLGKLAKQAAASTVSGTVKVDGKTIGTVNSNTLKLKDKQLTGKQIEISTTGTGKLYYFYSTEGVPTGPVKEEDNFMRVRKTFYNRFGHVISGNSFKSNELIIVGITIENAYGSTIDNVVITDLLPAGFEIENHRVKQLPGMSWIKDANYATHIDIRDDRINFYLDLNSGKSTYYYAVRAVSSGSFKMGPVMAVAMYRGDMYSYNGAGTITISAR